MKGLVFVAIVSLTLTGFLAFAQGRYNAAVVAESQRRYARQSYLDSLEVVIFEMQQDVERLKLVSPHYVRFVVGDSVRYGYTGDSAGVSTQFRMDRVTDPMGIR
jgi:hypothetical protein